MQADIIISLGLCALAIFMTAQIARSFRAASVHKTLRKAIEHGQTLNPDVVEQLDRAPTPGVADQRIGLVLVALALALFLAAAIEPGDDAWKELITIALFPLLVGIALLARPWLSKRLGGE